MKYLTLVILLVLVSYSGKCQFVLSYDNATNLVSVNYNGCDDPCRYTPENRRICSCQRECENFENEIHDDYQECLDYCSENHGQYEYNYELLKECEEQCETNLLVDIARCKNNCGELQERCTPCGIRYRLIADIAAIPFDPLQDPGSRVFSPWIEQGGFEGDWNRCSCDNINGTLNGDPWTGDLESFELPSSWQQIIQSSNRCFGIEVFINYMECPSGNTFCGICSGTIWTCEIIG